MLNPLKLKMFICKILTCFIPSSKDRKLAREFLFWFSYSDYIRFKNANYHIVSLGRNCVTRTLAVATGLKPRRMYGEKSCPFDFYVSDLSKTIDLIKNDFDEFFNNIDINAFPHDEKFNLKHFKKRYAQRIQNFLDIQNSDKKVYYIYSNYNNIHDTQNITKLYNVLKDKRKGKPFELILLTKKRIDVANVIQIPYDIDMNDSQVNEFIINRYKDINNKFTEYTKVMKIMLKDVIAPSVSGQSANP